MRSHVTRDVIRPKVNDLKFQYRKRYEITCDYLEYVLYTSFIKSFQYRKRYEITCD